MTYQAPLITPATAPQSSSSSARPGETFVWAFYAAWNAGGWPAVEPLIDEQFDDHASPPAWRFGRAGFRAARQASAQVLRDVQIRLNAVYTWTQPDALGQPKEYVLAMVDILATFAGPQPLRGIPPSAGPIVLPAWSLFRLAPCPGQGLPADRILAEHWELQNLHAVWQAVGGPAQVGSTPPST